MVGLSDLDFGPGLEIQKCVRDRFGSMINFSSSPSSREFFLVASVGRSAICLNCDSVALILKSCLGSVAKDFFVTHLSDLMFRFTVDTKSVFFDLWGANGPNWKREYHSWVSDQEKEWTTVSHSKKKSYVQVAKAADHFGRADRCDPPATSCLVFSRLDIPDDHALFSPQVEHSICESDDQGPVRGSRSGSETRSGSFQNFKLFGPDLDAQKCSLCFWCLTPGHVIVD